MNYRNLIPADVNSQVELVQTCFACPEQYDMLLDGKYVGYFRMRHGEYTVSSLTDSNTIDGILYEAYPNGDGDFDEDEREFFLTMGKIAVLNRLGLIRLEQEIPTSTGNRTTASPNQSAPLVRF